MVSEQDRQVSEGEAGRAASLEVTEAPAAQGQEGGGERRFVVGIGASAGGLEAISTLVSHLPPDLGASYLIVQHLSPTHRSMLVQLIARETTMPVSEAEHGAVPQPNHLYITPPNRNVVLKEGRMLLTEPAAEAIPKPSINQFFVSLAEDRGEDALAVVLSGTGSDGAVGVRAIKASGGLVFAQETSTAKYSGMPQAAIDTDCVDWVMSPDKIAEEIAIVVRAQGAIGLPSQELPVPPTLRTLLKRVMRHARVDFSGYKESTVWRRILRRMVSNRVHSLEDYLALTEKNPEELNQLCKEILISVTSFFRDPQAFEALRAVMEARLHDKQPGDEVRCWVAGCATGEEAYSIAIMVSELLGPRMQDLRVQIFATDIDLNAMAVARRGVYPESSVSEMAPVLLERYFIRRDNAYEVSKQLRDMVIFARQDLAQDPPFLRLDLLTCRNVLIYFQNGLQDQVLTTFHYALKAEGILFLGKSETAHQREELFEVLVRDCKIFRRKSVESRLPTQNMNSGVAVDAEVRMPALRSRAQSLEDLLVKTVLESTLPPSVVVSSQLDIRHVFGDVSPYLVIPAGRPDFNLLGLLRPEWRLEAQTLIYQVLQRKQPVIGRLRAGRGGIRMAVRPLGRKLQGLEDAILVSFESISGEEMENSAAQGHLSPEMGQSLEEELIATREHLQTVIEELETSNEETQALNEELQASNEELQASNEELQASNEELQSTNEELTTVNEELQIKTAELAETNADLENIQNGIGFMILVVNDQMRLVRYNLTAAQWLALTPGMIGESLRAIPHLMSYQEVVDGVSQVLETSRPVEKPLIHDGRYYLLRVIPRMMSAREALGCIVTLREESELVETQRRLRESEHRLLSIMNHSSTAIAVKDMAGRYEYVNPRFCEVFALREGDAIGKTDRQLFPESLAAALRERDLDTLRADDVLEAPEILPLPEGERRFLGIRFPLKDEEGITHAICLKLVCQKHLDA